jgi:hypothetical protein
VVLPFAIGLWDREMIKGRDPQFSGALVETGQLRIPLQSPAAGFGEKQHAEDHD